MPALAELQAAFRAALLGEGDGAIAAALAPPADGGGLSARARIDVYRNNVASALLRSLEGLYPALARLTGADFFAALVREYVRAHPPTHGRLVEYGFELPAFLAERREAAAARYPWLADVARLELAWRQAYVAAEAPPLAADELARVPAERMADVVLELHPSSRLLASPYPVSELRRIALDEEGGGGGESGSGGGEGRIEVEGGAERLLVVRPRAEVEVRTLTEGGFALVQAIDEGRALGIAYERARAVEPEFDLRGHLAALLRGETFAGFRLGPPEQPEQG